LAKVVVKNNLIILWFTVYIAKVYNSHIYRYKIRLVEPRS